MGPTPSVTPTQRRERTATGWGAVGRHVYSRPTAQPAMPAIGSRPARPCTTPRVPPLDLTTALRQRFSDDLSLGGAPAGTPYKSQDYDAFGRGSRAYGYDQQLQALIVQHALSTDVYDAADYYATIHQGTYATSVSDGHGRGVVRMQRIKVGAAVELRSVINDLSSFGRALPMTQRRTGAPMSCGGRSSIRSGAW